jgi:(2Fe-2S) ferredoxin
MPPKVLLCLGADCQKRKRKHTALAEAVRECATIEKVSCQKICKGPVAGIYVDGRLEWFRRLDSKKARKRLVELLTQEQMHKKLKKLRVKKRSGRLRTKAPILLTESQ